MTASSEVIVNTARYLRACGMQSRSKIDINQPAKLSEVLVTFSYKGLCDFGGCMRRDLTIVPDSSRIGRKIRKAVQFSRASGGSDR